MSSVQSLLDADGRRRALPALPIVVDTSGGHRIQTRRRSSATASCFPR